MVMAARNQVQGGRGPASRSTPQLPIAPMGVIPTRYYVTHDRPSRACCPRWQPNSASVRSASPRCAREGMVDEGSAVRRPHRGRHPPGPPTRRCRRPSPRWPTSTPFSINSVLRWKGPRMSRQAYTGLAGPDRGLPGPAAGRPTTGRRSPCSRAAPADPRQAAVRTHQLAPCI